MTVAVDTPAALSDTVDGSTAAPSHDTPPSNNKDTDDIPSLNYPNVSIHLIRFRWVILLLSIVPIAFLSRACTSWNGDDRFYGCDYAPYDYLPSLGALVPGVCLYLFRVFVPSMAKVNRGGTACINFILFGVLMGWYIKHLVEQNYRQEGWRMVEGTSIALAGLAMLESVWSVVCNVQFWGSEEYKSHERLKRETIKKQNMSLTDEVLQKSLQVMEEGRKNDQGRLEHAMELIQVQQKQLASQQDQIRQLLSQGTPPGYLQGQGYTVGVGQPSALVYDPVGGSEEIGHKYEAEEEEEESKEKAEARSDGEGSTNK